MLYKTLIVLFSLTDTLGKGTVEEVYLENVKTFCCINIYIPVTYWNQARQWLLYKMITLIFNYTLGREHLSNGGFHKERENMFLYFHLYSSYLMKSGIAVISVLDWWYFTAGLQIVFIRNILFVLLRNQSLWADGYGFLGQHCVCYIERIKKGVRSNEWKSRRHMNKKIDRMNLVSVMLLGLRKVW